MQRDLAFVHFLHGAASGAIIHGFVVLIRSWYQPREIPLRLLVWTTGSQVISLLFSIIIQNWPFGNYLIVLVFAVQLFIGIMCTMALSGWAYSRFGTPEQVSWMPTDERVQYASIAAGMNKESFPDLTLEEKPWGRATVS